MNELWIGLGMLISLLGALLIGVPVAFAMIAIAMGSIGILGGGIDGLGLVASTLWYSVANFTLTAVPLFILMGAIISASGMGARLYNSLAILMQGVPGSLTVATTLACTVMATVSGSSVATAGAIGHVSINEMRRFGYKDETACGAVAAGGTLGILIPPSIPLIIYGIIAQESIGKLFIAGIVPGIIMVLSFVAYQVWIGIRETKKASSAVTKRVTPLQRLAALKHIVPLAILVWVILGTIYQGIATPTEAAALGVLASLLLSAAIYRELSWGKIVIILKETAKGSVMVLMIIAGAMLFGYAMTTTNVAPTISRVVAEMNVAPWVAFIMINLLLFFLGCFMETLSIIVITAPILVPIIIELGWDPVWFGIIMVINMEMALITPPVGLNLFVIQGVVKDVPLTRIIVGTMPYVFIMAIVLLLVGIFPDLVTFLPMNTR